MILVGYNQFDRLPCWVLLNLWISSIKSIVDRWNRFRSFLAFDTSVLTCATPESQAERRLKRHRPFFDLETSDEITLTKLVFPQPGGP